MQPLATSGTTTANSTVIRRIGGYPKGNARDIAPSKSFRLASCIGVDLSTS
jgi:hypothetical protein